MDPFGLINNSNICYANSTLQCFYSCKSFLKSITNLPQEKIESNLLLKIIKYLIVNNSSNDPSVKQKIYNSGVRIIQVLLSYCQEKKINFTYGQQDANEFIHIFIDLISKENINKLFEFTYTESNICIQCKNIIKKNVTSIILNIHDIYKEQLEQFKTLSHMSLSKNIETNNSYITGYKCEKCGSTEPKFIKSELSQISNILIISSTYKRDINFESSLCIKGITYNLIGVVEHHGNQNYGHYITHVKRDNQWYYINDEYISKQEYPNNNKNVCMVFYEKEK